MFHGVVTIKIVLEQIADGWSFGDGDAAQTIYVSSQYASALLKKHKEVISGAEWNISYYTSKEILINASCGKMRVYHETQHERQCGLCALNHVVQRPYFTTGHMVDIQHQIVKETECATSCKCELR